MTLMDANWRGDRGELGKERKREFQKKVSGKTSRHSLLVSDKKKEFMHSISEDGKLAAVPNSGECLEFTAGCMVGTMSSKDLSPNFAILTSCCISLFYIATINTVMTQNNLGEEGIIIADSCTPS